MKTIKVELMQHTPMIHFQYDQDGATLRASEVKPKLDRFLLDKLGKDVKKEWLVGSGTHDALDYKMRFEAKDARMKNIPEEKMKSFPMVLANNMSGKDKKNKVIYFSMHETVTMTLSFFSKDYIDKKTREKKHRDETWYEKLNLNENLPKFFATTNFGQRSNKGFGSFTVKSIDGSPVKDEKFIKTKPYLIYDVWEGEFMKWWKYRTEYEKEQRDKVYSFSIQWNLFEKMKKLWDDDICNEVKNKAINYKDIDSTESYIKCMKEIYCKKGYNNKNFPYLPGPIMFKPISFVDGVSLSYCVNILPDNGMIQRLRMTYGSKVEIDRKNKVVLHPSEIGNMNVIKEIVDKIQ